MIFRPANNRWYIMRTGGSIREQEWGVANEDWMVPGDYDNDGIGDIALYKARRPESGIGSSARIIQFRRTSGGVPGDEPIARDYDGDGKTDMAVVRRTGGNMIWYLFFSSTNSFTSRQFGLAADFTAG